MHTSDVLRTHHFRVTDGRGQAATLAARLAAADRLGVVSPRYEDAIVGASAAILAFVTAFYDLQRAKQQETGRPFFVYADYYVFLFGTDGEVRGQAGPAPLEGAVSSAYGWLDVWPEEKWVVVRDVGELWAQVGARRVTHLLLPAHPATDLGAIPAAVAQGLKAVYRYLLPDEQATGDVLRIDLAEQPRAVVAEVVRRLPPGSPAHAVDLTAPQRVVI
jgi:hypothetical protein